MMKGYVLFGCVAGFIALAPYFPQKPPPSTPTDILKEAFAATSKDRVWDQTDPIAKALKSEQATPVEEVKPRPYDCHFVAIEAASAFELFQREYEKQDDLDPRRIDYERKRKELHYRIKWFSDAAKEKATEYVAHPECTEDAGDMHTILK
jgi:hypothetical protein